MQLSNKQLKSTVAKSKSKKRTAKGDKKISIIIKEEQYPEFMDNLKFAKSIIDEQYKRYPQLFPKGFENRIFNGTTKVSEKMRIAKRQVVVNGEFYQLHPSFQSMFRKFL